MDENLECGDMTFYANSICVLVVDFNSFTMLLMKFYVHDNGNGGA